MDKPSRTKKKKAAEGLQKLGEQLLGLDDAQLNALDLPAELKAAVVQTRTIKSHGARRRQLQYIGRLMRSCEPNDVQEALNTAASREDDKRRRFKMVERWRDELVKGSDDRLAWVLANFSGIDQQQLNHLIDCARGGSTRMNAREAARKLFRLLAEVSKT